MDGDADELPRPRHQTDGGGRKRVRGPLNPLRPERQGHVHAVVDEELRSEFLGEPVERPRHFQKRAGRKILFPDLKRPEPRFQTLLDY